MSYYFVRATTNFGPWNFPMFVEPVKTIASAVAAAATRQGVIACCDWTAEPIDEPEYHRLAGGYPRLLIDHEEYA